MVLSMPAVLGYNRDNMVKEKLEPLQQCLGLADEQLKKIVLSMPPVLGLNHDNMVKEKLEPWLERLDKPNTASCRHVVAIYGVCGCHSILDSSPSKGVSGSTHEIARRGRAVPRRVEREVVPRGTGHSSESSTSKFACTIHILARTNRLV